MDVIRPAASIRAIAWAMRRRLVLGLPLSLLGVWLGCAEPAATTEPEAAVRAPSEGEAPTGIAGAGPILTELPNELVAELRLAGTGTGTGADGRLLTLAAGFIATVECSDCGAPTYQWFLAVRCADDRHCEVLTAECEGVIRRDDADRFVVDLHPIEGTAEGAGASDEAGAAAACAGYTGTFEAL